MGSMMNVAPGSPMPQGSIQNSIVNGQFNSQPTAPPQDPAEMLKALANSLQPNAGPPPQVASPLAQALALFAAHSGASLLHDPNAAAGAEHAVNVQQALPEEYRQQQAAALEQTRRERLQLMINSADLQSKAALNAGDHEQALKLAKQAESAHADLDALDRASRSKDVAAEIAGRQGVANTLAGSRMGVAELHYGGGGAGDMSKWPQYMKNDYTTAVRAVNEAFYKKDSPMTQKEHEAKLAAIHEDFMARDQALGTPDTLSRYGQHSAPTTANASLISPPGTPPAPASGVTPPVVNAKGLATLDANHLAQLTADYNKMGKAQATQDLEAHKSALDPASYRAARAILNQVAKP
jgi:hypothetical protein